MGEAGMEQRRNTIRKIEEHRRSDVVCYFLSDRPNASARIADDVMAVLHRHIAALTTKGNAERLDLVLYSRGGDTMTPWQIATFIREFYRSFHVLVPFRAHSAATLICLGADSIVMTSMAQLSPVDPSITTPYNEVKEMPDGSKELLEISVEDAAAYLDWSVEKGGLRRGRDMVQLLCHLSDQVHPLALGRVHRTHTQIRQLARKLLQLHMAGKDCEKRRNHIVDMLTERLYSHQHMIGRREARDDIRLPVEDADEFLEGTLSTLYNLFAEELQLAKPASAEQLLADAQILPGQVMRGPVLEETKVGIVESRCRSDACVLRREAHCAAGPGKQGAGVQYRAVPLGWQVQYEEDEAK